MDNESCILFVDAYDSFSQNIVALLRQETGADVSIVRIDTDIKTTFNTNIDDFIAQFDAIVIGPGPGNPCEAHDIGILYQLLDSAAARAIPTLGICLGFQVLCVKYGFRIERMKEPRHGHSKNVILIDGDTNGYGNLDIFRGIEPGNIWATCYNSLGLTVQNAKCEQISSRPESSGTNASFSSTTSHRSVESLSPLTVLAVDDEDNVMAIAHRHLPFWGVQFHPESCKSNQPCRQVVQNWWYAAQTCNQRVNRHRGPRSSPFFDGSCERTHHIQVLPKGGPSNERQPAGTSSEERILSQLLTVSTTTGNRVQYAKVKVRCNPEQISQYIHEISGLGAVAMLESTKKGRFSIYAVPGTHEVQPNSSISSEGQATWQLQYREHLFSVSGSSSYSSLSNVPASRDSFWIALQAFVAHRRAVGGPTESPFWGGFIGYVSYEHGLSSLGIAGHTPKSRTIPDISLVWVERSIVYDNQTRIAYIQSIRRCDENFINDMAHQLSSFGVPIAHTSSRSVQPISNLQAVLDTAQFNLPERNHYYSQFRECQYQLHAGNSYELCLTTDTTISMMKPKNDQAYEFELYRNLHAHNPVPFGAFLRLSDVTILGTSPEQYMSWSRDGIIDMIPMKGTVRRSADMTLERASAILSSPKESAENLMIADLIRHDLYSVVGSNSNVEVVKLCEVVEHETVYQLVSHIRAHVPLEEGLSDNDRQIKSMHYGLKALRETMPPGSMTGAPKKRSCEILSDLEQRNRGVYSGILGYIDVGGAGNWNVCIRTAFRCESETKSERDDKEARDIWHLGAGGAITVLSTAEGEWQEMMVKLNSVLQGFKTVKM